MFLHACSGRRESRNRERSGTTPAVVVRGERALLPAPPLDSEDGQWTMPAKNYASTRFSGVMDRTSGEVLSANPFVYVRRPLGSI